MDSNLPAAGINSPDYWNKRFYEDWLAEGGHLQTVFFAELCVRELPQWLVDEVRLGKFSIFDYGCALGDALPVWCRIFPDSAVAGGDVAQIGLAMARQRHPQFAFTDLAGTEPADQAPASALADLVYCSNTLEHFADWQALLERLARGAGKFVVLMVPFEEDDPIPEHAATFEYDRLPPLLPKGHRLLHLAVVDAAAEPDSHWNGQQLVAVYGRDQGRCDGAPLTPRDDDAVAFDLRAVPVPAIAALLPGLAAISRARRRAVAQTREARREVDRLTELEAKTADRLHVLDLTLAGIMREYADLLRGLEEAQQWVKGRLNEVDPGLLAAHELPPVDAAWLADSGDVEADHRTQIARMITAAHRGNRLALAFLVEADRWVGERAALRAGLRQTRAAMEQAVGERDRARRAMPTAPPQAGDRQPLISIVLPVFNQAYLVVEAIAGVRSQTYPNWELIIVDDGSTDDLAERVRPHLEDRRILFLRQPNQRLPAALNQGFARARGELLTWTSADNIMLPPQLEQLAAELAAHPEAGLAYSDYWAIDDRGEPLADPDWRHHNRDPELADLIRLPDRVTVENFHRSGDNFIGASFLYRRAVADIVGPYADDTFGGEDYDFWLRLHLVCEFRHVAEPLYKYRVHADTLTARAEGLGLYDNIRDLLDADRWRLETLIEDGGLQHGDGLLRPLAQFHAAVLRRCRPLAYRDLAARVASTAAAKPLVVDIDVPARLVDPAMLRQADILLCRSTLTASLLRREIGARPKRILVWDGEATPALQHAYMQAFADQVTLPVAPVYRAPARLDMAAQPSRILLLVERWSAGGMETVVVDLAESLAAAGCHVVVATAHGAAPPAAAFDPVYIDSAALRGDSGAFENLLRQHRIEIVNYHHSRFAVALVRQLGIATVYTLHNSYLWMADAERAAVGAELRMMNAVIAVSRQAAQFAFRQFALPAERILVIANGLRDDMPLPATRPVTQPATRAASRPGAPFVVAMVASLTRPKLQHAVIAAFAEAAAAIPALRLRLIGVALDPQYRAELEAQIVASPAADRITLVGGISRRETAAELAAAHVFVLPSLVEGCSMALLEAAAAGCVCIASDVGSARDLSVHGGPLILLPSPLGELDAVTQQEFLAAAHAALPQHRANIAAALELAWRDYGALSAGTPRMAGVLRQIADMRRMTEAYRDAYAMACRGGGAALHAPAAAEALAEA